MDASLATTETINSEEVTPLSEVISVDVVGVDMGDNGRSCANHNVCGHFVGPKDILVTKWAIMKFGEAREECYPVWKISRDDGLPQCLVGFLPRRVFVKKPLKYFDHVVLRVVEDLRVSENKTERARSHRNYGVLYCKIIHEDERYIGKRVFDGESFDMTQEEERNLSATDEEDSDGNSNSSSDSDVSSLSARNDTTNSIKKRSARKSSGEKNPNKNGKACAIDHRQQLMKAIDQDIMTSKQAQLKEYINRKNLLAELEKDEVITSKIAPKKKANKKDKDGTKKLPSKKKVPSKNKEYEDEISY